MKLLGQVVRLGLGLVLQAIAERADRRRQRELKRYQDVVQAETRRMDELVRRSREQS